MTTQNTHLHIEGVTKKFNDFTALNNIDLKIERGSFVCLLGPSGCGKTTLLRIIAGFEKANSGRLMLDGIDISQMPPHKRGFGMVFQSLALFPHMSVADNIAYGLKLRGVGGKQRRDRVDELLEVIELPAIADRPVSALSGGQQQRVAIARALAIQPKLFLLDEPLSALDAKLRDNMQIELRQLQRKFGVTTVLVTHDQTEAMMLADELVVMKDGEIRQSDDPSNVYRQPVDQFVADFLGAANILNGEVSATGNVTLFGEDTSKKSSRPPGSNLTVAVRAEHIELGQADTSASQMTGIVEFMRDLGPYTEWIIAVRGEKLRVRSNSAQISNFIVGQEVGIAIKADNLSIFES